LGTFASRVLGMVRDMATAALLGMSGSPVMDAFVVAFRIPNLFRRLFGEGALTASYVPVLAARLEKGRAGAWQLVSVGLVWLSVILAGVVLVAEGVCVLIYAVWGASPGMPLLLGLTALMMPYMLFVCLAAQVAATLQCLAHFAIPALAPILLNICWLAAVWGIAPWFAPDQEAQAAVLAGSILVAGVLQLAVQWPKLRAFGFRFDYNWPGARDSLHDIATAMGPMVLGLAITQINTLMDSLIAWSLSAPPDGPQEIAWLGGVRYPMQQGAASSIYYGERLYEFPLAIVGIAVATAIFPLLSRHAARGDHPMLGADLTLGLRLVLFLGVPASLGLILLAEPLARLLFQRGEFIAADTVRAARMIACYAGGVWAYCALPVVVRGYYSLGDRITPVRIGAAVVGLNLVLNLILVWPLAEAGLAVSTSVAAVVQLALLIAVVSRRDVPLDWKRLAGTGLRTIVAAAAMAIVGYAVLHVIPAPLALGGKLAQVFAPFAACVLVYLAVHAVLGGGDLRMAMGKLHEPQ
jgi:putative peptidoglycan lipid II flippase